MRDHFSTPRQLLRSRFRRAALVGAAVLALTSAPLAAFAEGIDDILFGRATTSTPGIPFPVEVTGQTFLPAGCVPTAGTCTSVKVTYNYRSSGLAIGELPGRFGYFEQGAFITDMAGVQTGSEFYSGAFTVDPIRPGAPNVVVSFPSVVIGGGVIGGRIAQQWNELPIRVQQYLQTQLGLAPGSPYATFTFQNSCGTHHGYATVDFRRIAIEITLSC